MKQPKVSVCIPIYNVEKYIEKCVRSLLLQTLDEMEFLFCDDCSPDNSMQILVAVLKEYPHRVDSIKILRHKQNLGHDRVFKTLLTNATGEYVITCDSDDWVEPEMYEKMYITAKQCNADVVGCGHYIEYAGKSNVYINKPSRSKDKLLQEWINRTVPVYSWATLVHHSIIKKLEYISCGYVEDCTRACQVLHYSSNYIYITEPLYHYRCQKQGVTSYAKFHQRIQLNQIGYTWIFDFIVKKYDDQYYKDILQTKLMIKMGWIRNVIDDNFYSIWPEANRCDILKLLNISIEKKMILWLAIHHHKRLCNSLLYIYNSLKK